MKKLFVFLTLIAVTGAFAAAQDNAVKGKYTDHNTLTRFDSTGVYMEESGLSHVLTHKCIEMYSFAGCAAYSTYKIDYDPLSAYCDIERVLVHRPPPARRTPCCGPDATATSPCTTTWLPHA